MNDAEKREKVIRGLEAHANPQTCETCAGEDCPYYDIGDSYPEVTCSTFLAADALALLKEQEARVMTLEELDDYCIRREDEDPYTISEKVPVWIDYLHAHPYNVRWMTVEWLRSCIENPEMRMDYGKDWRCWTSRPTPEQMRETPWEGEEDHEA